jgi:predicted metal-binding protein
MSGDRVTLTVCASCPMGRGGLADRLRSETATEATWLSVATVDCMSGCTRPSTLAIRAPGKTAYLLGDLDEGDLPLVHRFLHLYRESKTGDFADARCLGDLRFKAIARIPAG